MHRTELREVAPVCWAASLASQGRASDHLVYDLTHAPMDATRRWRMGWYKACLDCGWADPTTHTVKTDAEETVHPCLTSSPPPSPSTTRPQQAS